MSARRQAYAPVHISGRRAPEAESFPSAISLERATRAIAESFVVVPL